MTKPSLTLKHIAPCHYVRAAFTARDYERGFMRDGRGCGVRNGVLFKPETHGMPILYVYHTKAGNIVVTEVPE